MRDAHFHLNSLPRAELPALIDAALARGCQGGLVAGVWNDDTRELAAWAESPSGISPALAFAGDGTPASLFKDDGLFRVAIAHGLHPAWLPRHCSRLRADGTASAHSPAESLERALIEFESLLASHRKRIFALGEIGFDAHPHLLAEAAHLGLAKSEILALQGRVFQAVVEIAQRENLPVIVHSRGSWALTLEHVVLARREHGVGVMIHCYGGPAQDVRALAAQGVFLSFGGVPTWERALKVRAAFLACPPEALLVETDAPDLPVELEDGTRPARHEPAHLADVVRRLADLRGVPRGEFEAACDANLLRYLVG